MKTNLYFPTVDGRAAFWDDDADNPSLWFCDKNHPVRPVRDLWVIKKQISDDIEEHPQDGLKVWTYGYQRIVIDTEKLDSARAKVEHE